MIGKLLRSVAVAALLASVGCASVEKTRQLDGSLVIDAGVSGWFLFGFIPLVCGNPDGGCPIFFLDRVTPRETTAMLDRELVREKAKSVGPLITRETDETVLFVFSRVSYHTTATIPLDK